MAQITLQEVINEIQEDASAITGIELAPDYLPENVAAFPAIVTYARTGNARTGEFGIADIFHNVVVEFHYPRIDLSTAIAAIMPYLETIMNALTADPWFNETCETFDRISYTFGPMQYAEQKTIGFRFVIENLKMFPYGKQ